MKPLHEITFEEFANLPLDVKVYYKKNNPNIRYNILSFSGVFYINCLLAHIQNGGKITKKIWKSIPENYQNFLKRNFNEHEHGLWHS